MRIGMMARGQIEAALSLAAERKLPIKNANAAPSHSQT